MQRYTCDMSLGSDAVTGDDTAAIQAEYSVISINLVAVRNLCRDNKHVAIFKAL